MAAGQPNPTKLSISTKFPPPGHARSFSRSKSPSRSPVRKAQFAARELDPLLKNLSPDSTLEALQETNALGGNHAEHSAIARSISDASEAERELGIRAAIAAKKLREWTEEVTAWPWPTCQDRAQGAGFMPPSTNEQGTPIYFGSLPKGVVQQHEERLDEIWDAIDTLGIDEIKHYVFSSHHPTSSSASREPTSAYGRMRDFTALITATVIQALPVLANLHTLLETWSVRLAVLRQIPDLLAAFAKVKSGLRTINDIVHDDKKNRKLTKGELEAWKVVFGNKVSNLGKRVDNLLDLLEGQEDPLPPAWIDSLEDIENKYAEWVAQAEGVVLRNEIAGDPVSSETRTLDSSPGRTRLLASVCSSPNKLQHNELPDSIESEPVLAAPTPDVTAIKPKPLVETNPNAEQGHRREFSEISMAGSTLSGYSFENAEIIDATATPVLPSPRISVVDLHFPATKGSPSWMTTKKGDQNSPSPHHGLIQRASTASIEFVPKEQIREVMLRRSLSHDILSTWKTPSNTLQPALKQSAAPPSAVASPAHDLGDPIPYGSKSLQSLTPPATSPSPSLRTDPPSLNGKYMAESPADPPADPPPALPRRSSKRLSMPLLNHPKYSSTPPQKASTGVSEPHSRSRAAPPITPPSKIKREETFDDRLKSILASIPTKIRLTEGSDSGSSGVNSEISSRASSPIRPLKLSPVKDGKSGYNGTSSSGIRVYHLKGGKSRDTPPIKLYVRAVGENGERVMVRVGGGWADLAEYLREYSLHHGGRGLAEPKLEVAGFPGHHKMQNSGGSFASVVIPREPKSSVAGQRIDPGLSESSRTPAEENKSETNSWRRSPVPFALHPIAPQARSPTPTIQNRVQGLTPTPQPRPSSRISTTTATTPTITATTTSGNSYTPLGAAGPVQKGRRATSYTLALTPSSEAWVEGMVNQARAVSGSHAPNAAITPTSSGNTTVVQAPTTVTRAAVSLSRTQGSTLSKRLSSWSSMPTITTLDNSRIRPPAISSPQGSQLSNTSSDSSGSFATPIASESKNGQSRRKSRMNLGDVGGIKRVFLRKKSDRSMAK